MTILTVVVTVLTALIFLAAAILKFRKDPHTMQTRDRLGIAPGPYTLIGVCEVAGGDRRAHRPRRAPISR